MYENYGYLSFNSGDVLKIQKYKSVLIYVVMATESEVEESLASYIQKLY